MPPARDDFDFVHATGLVDQLIDKRQLIAEKRIARNILGDASAAASNVVEHPTLPFISHPYEWSFGELKAAALLQLDTHLAALESGVTLSDATAYNVQFLGSKPVFIESLSFRRYVDGEYWAAHRQFSALFLNPLLLRAKFGLPHNAWYRGTMESITAEQLTDLLPWHSKLSWGVFTNVVMQARLQNTTTGNESALRRAEARKLPLIGHRELLRGMRRLVASLEPKGARPIDWQDYANENSYLAEEQSAKRAFVTGFAESVAPAMLWDIGCNSGDYSVAALQGALNTSSALTLITMRWSRPFSDQYQTISISCLSSTMPPTRRPARAGLSLNARDWPSEAPPTHCWRWHSFTIW